MKPTLPLVSALYRGIPRLLKVPAALLLLLLLYSSTASAQTVEINKIIDNGPDENKKVFLVMGDGYTAADKPKFNKDVDHLLMAPAGVFGHDIYQQFQRAFNVYRVNLVSIESGVSKPQAPKNTALKTVFLDDFALKWVDTEKNHSNDLIDQLFKDFGNLKRIKFDYILVLLNESRYGGKSINNRIFMTCCSNLAEPLLAHELGHVMVNLYDEYFFDGQPDPYVDGRNCSTDPNRLNISWKDLIKSMTPLPTAFSSGMDPNTVGAFQGCNNRTTGYYRPVDKCRMRDLYNDQAIFCPVCQRLMIKLLSSSISVPAVPKASPHLEPGVISIDVFPPDASETETIPQPQAEPGYRRLLIRITEGGSSEVINSQTIKGVRQTGPPPNADYLYEVVGEQGNALAVEFLPRDPFIESGFPDPNENKGHKISRIKTTTITVEVPVKDTRTDDNNLGIRLFKFRPDSMDEINKIKQLNPAILNELKIHNQLEKEVDLPARKLTPMIREKNVQIN